MQGLMQDHPLTLPHIFQRAELLFRDKEVVTALPTGRERITYGDWAERTRRLGGVLDTLGISADGRVATFSWNTSRHLELYFAAPCSGRVLHTLNLRLFPEQVTYIVRANHRVTRALTPRMPTKTRAFSRRSMGGDGQECPSYALANNPGWACSSWSGVTRTVPRWRASMPETAARAAEMVVITGTWYCTAARRMVFSSK